MSQHAVPLDSPRWRDLHTRRGAGAKWVSEALDGIGRGAIDAVGFDELWPELCSEDTTYDAAYAAAPYLVRMAEDVSRSDATEYLIVLGLMATSAEDVPADLVPGYQWAIETGLRLTVQTLIDCSPGHELRYLISAVAAFRSRNDLALALQHLDAIQEPCPTCGHDVYPSELQRIIETDQAIRAS